MDDQTIAKENKPKQSVAVTRRKQSLDRKKAERWLPAPELSDAQKQLVKHTIAKDCNDDEFAIFLYRCRAYWLDPLKGEISVQVRNKQDPTRRQMVVIVQRDGYLTIAHRSGQFGGMQSGSRKEGDELVGWAKVWNKSAPESVEVEVYEKEYSTGLNLWATKPRTMIQKVAESQALRRAFNISGVYDQVELDNFIDITPADDDTKRIEAALKKNKAQLEDTEAKPVEQEQ